VASFFIKIECVMSDKINEIIKETQISKEYLSTENYIQNFINFQQKGGEDV